MDRRARVRHFISSASCYPGLRTSSISTFRFRERHPPYKVCWVVKSPPASRPSAPSFRTSPSGAFVPHVRAGTLRALATTGAQRSPLLPDVPTVAEAGYPALEFAEWFGIFVPARTPSGTVETLSSALRTALQTKEVRA